MATYKITSPDGQVYRVTAPDGATEEQVIEYAQKSFKMAKAPTTVGQDVLQQGKNALGGFIRGAGSIGATIARPFESGTENDDRRKRIDTNMADLIGADPESWLYKGFKLGGEIAGTAGVGGVLANGLRAVPMLAKAAPVIDAIGSSGMWAGGLTGAKAIGARALGGAVSGGAQAGMVNPDDVAMGVVIGAATPGMLQLAGKFGQAVYSAVKGGKPGAGKMLADAMGVTEAELPAIIKALEAAPDSIVPGSKLTVNQALQLQGANRPGVKMLDRIVSGGPGGDALLAQYAKQGPARLDALGRQGAVLDDFAVRDEATRVGDKLGSILRTQALDDKAAARKAWEAVDARALADNVNLRLPIDEMQSAMKILGRGTVGAGTDARSVLDEARRIGTETLDAIKPIPKSAGSAQTLEQAVRSAGGIKSGNALSGELGDLRIKGSGTTGLVTKNGKPADLLAEMMYERGFITDNDPATLFEALRNGGGRKVFANDAPEAAYQRAIESSMGDMPAAEVVEKAVPFDEFQRLRRSAGSLGARVGSQVGNETEAGVLSRFQAALTQRADDAANGLLMAGDNISPEFLRQYNAARGMTKANAERYKGGNNITSILRKLPGRDYTLTGDEITGKLWHGGGGLAGDVANLKSVLNDNNRGPSMEALQRFILTDAASRTKASGELGAGLPRYVEQRMPGLLEAMTDDQMRAITGVATDIKNDTAARNVAGLLGSDTHAKVSRAMDGGLLDSPIAKTFGKYTSLHGFGGESLRSAAAESYVQHKGKTIAALMADPKAAAAALRDATFVRQLAPAVISRLQLAASRSLPVLAAD